jgi:hypothetical protein
MLRIARRTMRPGTSVALRDARKCALLRVREKRVTFDDVRKIALLWPEVEDGTSYGTPALKVRKKMLVRLKEDGDSLVMPSVPRDEREMLVESQPKTFYFTDHYRDYPIVLIRLSKASRATVEPLLRRHWRTLASKKAVKAFDTNFQGGKGAFARAHHRQTSS